MKIFITSPNENWILDRIKNGWIKNKPHLSATNLYEADIIWFLDSSSWKLIPNQILNQKKIVATINHVVPEKFKLNDFLIKDKIVDHYLVPCKQTKDFITNLTSKPITQIGYWCENELWEPYDKKTARNELSLDNSFIVGSFQRDTEGHDLKSPKLEKGPDLLCDYLERTKLKNQNLHVLLGGWRRQYVISRLQKADIPFTYYEMSSLETLRKMYAACDLYVVSSRYEGGPQALLEASFMRVPIVSTDVGMAKDILPDSCIIDVENDHYIPNQQDIDLCYKNVQKYRIIKHTDTYEKFFKKLLEGNI